MSEMYVWSFKHRLIVLCVVSSIALPSSLHRLSKALNRQTKKKEKKNMTQNEVNDDDDEDENSGMHTGERARRKSFR